MVFGFSIALAMYPFGLKELSRHDFLSNAPFDRFSLAVTGGGALPPVLSLYPFGIKEGPNGTSVAMYPLASFAVQAQGYVSKRRRFLSDAPFGRFSESLTRFFPRICGGHFPSLSF